MGKSIATVLIAVLSIGCANHQSPTSQPASRPSQQLHQLLTAEAPVSTDSKTTGASPQKIAEFQGEYRFLSNFWPAKVEHEGIVYPSSEHAYQAAKTLDMNERKKIAALPTPSEAKKAGRALALRQDWDTKKFEVMEEVVRYKFSHHPDLRQKLLSTGDAILEEGNNWGDKIWGVVDGQGENRLGKILMQIRSELRASDSPRGNQRH